MNRRSFIKGAMASLAGFNILPGAGRIWKAQVDTSQYRCVMDFPGEHILKSETVRAIVTYNKIGAITAIESIEPIPAGDEWKYAELDLSEMRLQWRGS